MKVEPPVEPPLRLHYVLDRRAWVVLVKGQEVKYFPDARPITARREALQFCYQKLKELETARAQVLSTLKSRSWMARRRRSWRS